MARFDYNSRVEFELGHSERLGVSLLGVAQQIATVAKQIGPVHKGYYIAGIQASHGSDTRGVLARVAATDWASGYIEFGTADTPTFAPLRRAAEGVVGNRHFTRR